MPVPDEEAMCGTHVRFHALAMSATRLASEMPPTLVQSGCSTSKVRCSSSSRYSNR